MALAGDMTSQIVVFFLFLFQITSLEQSVLDCVVDILVPGTAQQRATVKSRIQRAVFAVLFVPLSKASWHALLTLGTFWLLRFR